MFKSRPSEKSFVPIDDVATRYGAPRLWSPGKIWTDASSIASSKSSVFSRLSSGSTLSRRSSATSYATSFTYDPNIDVVPTLTKTPWELERSKRPNSRRSRPTSLFSSEIFMNLPQEIYDCILQQLEELHLAPSSETCATCYLRDIHSLALTSRAWDRSARKQLYTRLWIPTSESDVSTQKSRVKLSNRIKLLRRTLRERPALASLVRELKVSDLQQLYLDDVVKDGHDILDILASIVMACPNLERLSGFHATYRHEFDRLTHALSTRKNIKETVWILKGAEVQAQGYKGHSDRYPPTSAPPDTEAFLCYHDNWSGLHTLVLFGQGSGSLDYRGFVGTFRKLRQLKHLFISNFSSDDFNDRTLQALPPLLSLRLQELPGISDKGLLRFASSDAAKTLQSLSLVDLEIMFLPVLSKLFANLKQLRRFALVQDASPGLPPGAVMSQPIFASESLQFLHWDVLIPGTANEDMASSIEAGAFPRLRAIRAPSDHDGLLQDLCRPVAQIAHPSDLHLINVAGSSTTSETHYVRSLPAARRAAQERIEQARRRPALKIVVEDEGIVQHTYTIRSYMGTLGSKIEYCLEPDVEGSDDAIVSIPDLVKRRCNGASKSPCSGQWNEHHPDGKKWWYHSPRRHGRPIAVQKFF